MPSVGSASSHAVRIARRFNLPMRFRIAEVMRFGQQKMIAHSCNEGISLLKNALYVFKFNIVSGSIIINCRDFFVARQKLIVNGGQSRCFASTTLSMVSMIIPVAVINRRPRTTMFMLTWSLVTMTKEVGLPSLVKYGR